MATDINIIKVNDKIYFDSDTIAEIRELSPESPYKKYLDQRENKINEILQEINFICLAYEGEKSEREFTETFNIKALDDNEVTNMR